MTTIMTVDRAKFYDAVRASLFGGVLHEKQVEGMEAILDACESYGLWKRAPMFAGYIFATVRGEVGPDMQPVREGFKITDSAARKHVRDMYRSGQISSDYAARHANGKSYYGRGYSQLTHGENYKRLGKRIGEPLYEYPDLALDPKIAARILVVGMMEGLFTGRSLEDYLPESPRQARQVVNGMDRADQFAEWARTFERAIRNSLVEEEIPDPRDKRPQPVAEKGFWHYVWQWIKQLLGG